MQRPLNVPPKIGSRYAPRPVFSLSRWVRAFQGRRDQRFPVRTMLLPNAPAWRKTALK